MKWEITYKDVGQSIKDYLQNNYLFSSRLLKSIKFDGGSITINGEKVTVRYLLQYKDILEVVFPEEKQSLWIKPEKMTLNIVYEDDDIIVLNKDAGVAVSPSSVHQSGTIANGLLAYYKQNNIPYTVHFVTRLDRDTSGLLLIAKHRYAHMQLARLQHENKIKRSYVAIVEGILAEKAGVINEPIGRKDGSIIERTVTKEGKSAITHYKVIEEWTDYSMLSVQLGTGRTHQIRVHLAHLRHPLAGDHLYGGSKTRIKRHALHSEELVFPHFSKNKMMHFHTSIPLDMEKLLSY